MTRLRSAGPWLLVAAGLATSIWGNWHAPVHCDPAGCADRARIAHIVPPVLFLLTAIVGHSHAHGRRAVTAGIWSAAAITWILSFNRLRLLLLALGVEDWEAVLWGLTPEVVTFVGLAVVAHAPRPAPAEAPSRNPRAVAAPGAKNVVPAGAERAAPPRRQAPSPKPVVQPAGTTTPTPGTQAEQWILANGGPHAEGVTGRTVAEGAGVSTSTAERTLKRLRAAATTKPTLTAVRESA